jgi:hypothetical protein
MFTSKKKKMEKIPQNKRHCCVIVAHCIRHDTYQKRLWKCPNRDPKNDKEKDRKDTRKHEGKQYTMLIHLPCFPDGLSCENGLRKSKVNCPKFWKILEGNLEEQIKKIPKERTGKKARKMRRNTSAVSPRNCVHCYRRKLTYKAKKRQETDRRKLEQIAGGL